MTAGSATAAAAATVPDDLLGQLRATLTYARERDYCGWDLYDGESSRILRALPVDNRWVNLAFQQLPRRAPVNLRPLLLVETRRNFLGCALFALANVAAYDLTGDDLYRREARDLVDWLVENRSEGYAGYCGGHNHYVQGLSKRTHPDTPGIVGTSYAVKALLEAGRRFDESYLETARSAADFVFEDLEYRDHPDGARIKYKPDDPESYFTINANALGARLLVDLYDVTGEERLREGARGILDYVAARQADRGGWPYRDPPSSSHLSMDNFHNGYVLESLLRYGAVTGTGRYADTVADGASFYRDLFDPDGAPHFDEANAYPRDVHSSAQGGVVFTMLDDADRAATVLRWAVEHLSDGAGRFYHEQRRLYTKRITLMRWCQAWMAYGFARHLLGRSHSGGLVA
jgi:hypothetical protein